jgi:tetratricopeptide (TPR) repeat protein
MYSTDQFRVFSGAGADRLLSRPRRLVQEERAAEAEQAYQELLVTNPDLPEAWTELFALLRLAGRYAEALALAEGAEAAFGETGLSATLRGAALVELGRFREGLSALDEAARLDPDSGRVWHEAGYAAYRLGELSRALMALDRAFALEPHGSTLQLRGRVLRQAGRYLAAEVAFEGAAQAAEFPAQRSAAEAEIRVTRRFAAFPGSKPEALPPARRWFAEHGSAVLTGMPGQPATEAELVHGMVQLTRDLGWRFTAVVPLEAWSGWYDLAQALDVPVATSLPPEPAAIPLVAARNPAAAERWAEVAESLALRERGATLALLQPGHGPAADLVGQLGDSPPRALDLAFAVETSQHPEARLAGRVLA